MTISGVGTPASGNASQMLASLLAQMSNTQSVSTDTSSYNAVSDSSTASTGTANAQNALHGLTKPQLSSEILHVLMHLQQQDTGTTQNASNASVQNPLQQLFSAMDSDGDGNISQSEMESYIQAQGGTAAQADQLFSALDTSASGSISESQLAQDAHLTHSHVHGTHPHQHESGSELTSALDTSGTGTASQDPLSNMLSGNETASGPMASILASLNGDGTASTGQSNFAQSGFAAALAQFSQNMWGSTQPYSAYNLSSVGQSTVNTVA